MASVNGINANEKSMSGVVEDPVGDVIDCTLLIADSIESQNIYAQDGLVDCSLFNNDFATVTLGNTATNQINLGAFEFLVDTIRNFTAALNLYLFATTTGIIYFATSASQIVFGSSTALISAFVPTAANHLTNKAYVDSVAGGGVSLNDPNVWTDINTFENGIECESYYTEGFLTTHDMNIYPNLTNSGGKLTIGNFSGGRYIRLSPASIEIDSTTNLNFIAGADLNIETNNMNIEADGDLNVGTLISAGRTSLYSPAKTIIGNNMAESSTANTFSLITKLIGKDITIQGKSTSGSTSITNLATNINNTATDTITSTANASWLKNRYVYFDSATGGNSQINFNYYTYTTNPLIISSQVIASGGTATSLQGNLDTYCNAFRVWAPTALLGDGNGDVTINGANINLNGTNTNVNNNMIIQDAGRLWGTVSTGIMTLFNGNVCYNTNSTAIPCPDPASAPCGTTVIINFGKGNATTMALSTTIRDGFYFYLVNQSNFTCTLSSPTANIFGTGSVRGGQTTGLVGSNSQKRFQCCTFGSGTLNSTATNGWFAATF